MGDDVGIDEQQQFEYNSPETGSAPVPMRGFSEYGRKFSSLPPGIPLEPRGGSRSSTRSGSSRGSRSGVAYYLPLHFSHNLLWLQFCLSCQLHDLTNHSFQKKNNNTKKKKKKKKRFDALNTF